MHARIDSHHHAVPPFFREWLLAKSESRRSALPPWSVAGDLSFMDRHEIQTAILSISNPAVAPGTRAEARTMARRLNDSTAEVVSDRPDRFGFFATLTLPDVEGALVESAYALDELGADGVVLPAHAAGVYLGEDAYDELIGELDRRATVAFVHSSGLPGPQVSGIPPEAADELLDTVRAAYALACHGGLDRYPDLSFVLAHAGGFLPYVATRLARALDPDDEGRGLRLLRRFYVETALGSSPYSLPSLLAFTDPEHLVYGSDWPSTPADVVARFTDMLDAAELDGADPDHAALDRGTPRRSSRAWGCRGDVGRPARTSE